MFVGFFLKKKIKKKKERNSSHLCMKGKIRVIYGLKVVPINCDSEILSRET